MDGYKATFNYSCCNSEQVNEFIHYRIVYPTMADKDVSKEKTRTNIF